MPQSFDEQYAPKAMSLDELFAAIRPPPLLPVRYGPSDDDAYAPASSAPAANMPQATPSATPNSVVTRSYTDDITNRQLQTLHPAVRQDFADFLDDVNNQFGIQLRAYKGFRSDADQAKEYAKGRTAPGPRTTWAPPGESYHQMGWLPIWRSCWRRALSNLTRCLGTISPKSPRLTESTGAAGSARLIGGISKKAWVIPLSNCAASRRW